MPITQRPFGTTTDGRPVQAYTLSNGDMTADILDYGATLRALTMPGRRGEPVDVVLGYDTLAGYEAGDAYIGAVIGRIAGRIADGRIEVGGVGYDLACNDGGSQLHGGTKGFDRKVFTAEGQGDTLALRYHSPDGEGGYPGALDFCVRYTLADDGRLVIAYEARADADTVFMPTHHAYFNLDGEAAGTTIDDQLLSIDADRIIEMTPAAVATGTLRDVAGTPFDFRAPKPVGRDIAAEDDQIGAVGGYDHSFVLNGADHMQRPAATLTSARTGIGMRLLTTLPVLQVYAGMKFADAPGKAARLGPRRGIAIEAQGWPNAFAVPAFPKPLLKKGEVYKATAVYAFYVE